jgi:DNA N-6-adenine-methyltransferase (Dam)
MATKKGERKTENQIVVTPRPFLDAVEKRFGPIVFDLAATAENRVGPLYFGPGSPLGEDSLLKDWRIGNPGVRFLNPPYSDRDQPISLWAKRCAEMRRPASGPILLLCPAAVCTVWFRTWVAPHAYVLELYPRVFGKEIRDCILAVYAPEGYLGRTTWDWQDDFAGKMPG